MNIEFLAGLLLCFISRLICAPMWLRSVAPTVVLDHNAEKGVEKESAVSTSLEKEPVNISSAVITKIPVEANVHLLKTIPRAAPTIKSVTVSFTSIFRVIWYHLALYFFKVVYHISNERVLQNEPLPLSVSAVQMAMGVPFTLLLWMIKLPKLGFNVIYIQIGILQGK